MKKAAEARRRRHRRVRKKVAGVPDRPRLAVFRSNRHIYAQLIDDLGGRTIASASSVDPAVRGDAGGNTSATAEAVGKLLAERALQKGVESVVFDRGGFKFHGRVKSLADAARKQGLSF